MMLTTLIADDEPHAQEYLIKLVNKHAQLELLDVCNSGNEVVNFCKTLQPHIILLDIQMPGINGIETARKLLDQQNESIIIFTTAFDSFAINAFEVEALGYLLKPFSEDQFIKVIDRSISEHRKRSKVAFNERVERLYVAYQKRNVRTLTQLEIKEKGLSLKLSTQQILYISSDSEYVRLFTLNNMYLYRIALELLNKQLDSSFIRVHRSHIINLKHITEWKYLNNNTYQFKFNNSSVITSSKSYKDKIKMALANLRINEK